MCSAKGHVRFTPNSDHESAFAHKVMSALPPKADMCSAIPRVCFGPEADITASFDHLIGKRQQIGGEFDPECLSGLEVDYILELGRL